MMSPPDTPAPYFPPPPIPETGGPARRPVKWGCIAAAVGLAAIVTVLALCCALPGYRLYRFREDLGMPGMMGVGWLANVAQGRLDQAGQLTVGGEPAARQLADSIKAAIGDINNISPDMSGVQVREDTGAGTAEVSVPVTGTTRSGTCVLRMRLQSHGVWFVESLTMR